MKEAAAVVVAQVSNLALRTQQGVQKFGHTRDLSRDGLAGDQIMGEKHIERVDVIVGGLLEVAAVILHLRLQMLLYDRRSQIAPMRGMWEFREQTP